MTATAKCGSSDAHRAHSLGRGKFCAGNIDIVEGLPAPDSEPTGAHACDTVPERLIVARNAQTGHAFIRTPWGLAAACSSQGADSLRIYR